MSRLNFDNLSGFLSVELVTAATGMPAGPRGGAGSFDRHLEHARQTVERTAGAGGPPSADPRPEAETRRAAQDTRPAADPNDDARATPGSPSEDPSTAGPPRADSDRQADSDGQADADETQADGPPADEVSDADGASKEEDGPDDEQQDSAPVQLDGATGVDAAENASDQAGAEASAGSGEDAGAGQGESQAGQSTQVKGTSVQTGESGETQQAGPADGEAVSPEDAAAEEKDAGDPIVGQSKGPTEDQQNPDDAARENSTPGARDPSDASLQARREAAESERQGGQREGGRPLAESPGDRAPDRSVPGSSRNDAQHAASLASPNDASSEIHAEAGGTPTSGSTSSPGGGSETVAPSQASASQPTRQTSAGSAQGASGGGQADRARFVQRVARAFSQVGDRGGSIRLRLHPPELGSLRLEVTVQGGTMTARLEVETDSARAMLLDNLPALRDRLAEQQIKVGRFDVDLSDASSDGTPQRPGDDPGPHDEADHGSPQSRSEPEAESERSPQPRAAAPTGHASHLDVII
jgi:flagellar hook-length control protein FliK